MKAILEHKQHRVNHLIQKIAELEFIDKLLLLWGVLFIAHVVRLMVE